MIKFGDIIRKHGSRNAGDDLLGFQIDMDAFLEGSDLFEWIDVKQTAKDDCMLCAKCKLKVGISIAQARDDVRRIWKDNLRYTEFEEHLFEDTPDGFVFSLCHNSTKTWRCWQNWMPQVNDELEKLVVR